VLAGAAAAFYWQRQAGESAAHEAHVATVAKAAPAVAVNRLALGEAANAEALELAINPPAELDFLTREAVLQLRRNAVRQYPMLLAATYNPRPAVFGQIEDLAPWWGIEGQFFHGSGIRSIDGPAEESRFILNRYLRLAEEFDDWWSKDLSESRLPGFPLICPPQQMIWKPREAYAEVSYDAACIRGRQKPEFSLISYNARDFGFDYIYVSYADSQNVSKATIPTDAYANLQFIHRGGSCGYLGGRNNMSPVTPDIDDIRLEGLPAKVMVWLWKGKPKSVVQASDMRYAIHLRGWKNANKRNFALRGNPSEVRWLYPDHAVL
jgi:hypothetical protein